MKQVYMTGIQVSAMLQVHDQALSVMNSKGDKCCIHITKTEAFMSGFYRSQDQEVYKIIFFQNESNLHKVYRVTKEDGLP